MYIIAIGWAYVILMVAATSSSLIKGLAVLVGLGVLPLLLFTYVADAPRRRQRRTRESADQQNAADPQADR